MAAGEKKQRIGKDHNLISVSLAQLQNAIVHLKSSFWSICLQRVRLRCGPHFATYPGAVCDKRVDVVLGLVVIEQATPGQKCVHRQTVKRLGKLTSCQLLFVII